MMEDVHDSSKHWLELAETYLNTAFKAREIMEQGSPEDKRKLILTVGSNLSLIGKRIDFTFKKPYDILLKPEVRTNGLAG